jgi:hypothetical protein
MIKEIIAEAIVKLAGVKIRQLTEGRLSLGNHLDDFESYKTCWDVLYDECQRMEDIIKKHQVIYIGGKAT